MAIPSWETRDRHWGETQYGKMYRGTRKRRKKQPVEHCRKTEAIHKNGKTKGEEHGGERQEEGRGVTKQGRVFQQNKTQEKQRPGKPRRGEK